MAIHWQVKFRSLRAETLYTVNIYDDTYTYTDTPIQLTGAANPFETQEDDSDDPFQPVRTQSGYLRIVDTGKDNDGNAFDWRTFIPTTDTDRPVTLTDGDGTVVWMGFMQAQNLGARLYETPQQREFPLQCPLTVTSRVDINYSQTQFQNFAYLLWKVADSIPFVSRPASFVFQGGAAARDWLAKRIDWQNFSVMDDEGQLDARYNMLECLEEMCRFWGWTARMSRRTLYLVCADDTDMSDFLTLSYIELAQMAGTPGTYGTISSGLTPAGFGTNIFASVNNNDFQMRGPNKAVVTASCNAGETDIVKAFPESILKEMYGGGSYTESYDSGKRALFTDDMQSISSPLLTGTCGNDVSFNAMRVLESGMTTEGDDYTVIRIKPSYSPGVVLASLETIFEHNFYDAPVDGFSHGGLTMSFDVLRMGERYEYSDGSTIYFRVGIGKSRASALWYSSSGWTATPTDFPIRVGDSSSSDQKWACRTNDPNLHGRLFVDILGSNDMWHPPGPDGGAFYDRFDLVNFNLEFKRSVHDGISAVFDLYERKSSQEYVSSNEDMIEEIWSADTIFASDNDFVFGYGVLMNPDGTPFTGNSDKPEQHLADRIMNYWQASRRKIVCELLKPSVMELSPRVVGTIDGTLVYPISVSHNWKDDVVGVVFFELPEQTTFTS